MESSCREALADPLILPHFRRKATEDKDVGMSPIPPASLQFCRAQTHPRFQATWLLPTSSSRFLYCFLASPSQPGLTFWSLSSYHPNPRHLGHHCVFVSMVPRNGDGVCFIWVPSTGSRSRQCSVEFYRIEEGTLQQALRWHQSDFSENCHRSTLSVHQV